MVDCAWDANKADCENVVSKFKELEKIEFSISETLMQNIDQNESDCKEAVLSILNEQKLLSEMRSRVIERAQELENCMNNTSKTSSELTKSLEQQQLELNKIQLLENSLVEEIDKVKNLLVEPKERNEPNVSLKLYRDHIQSCKLLTGTSFVYLGKSVSGYVLEEGSKRSKTFKLDPFVLHPNQISGKLWETVEDLANSKE